MNLTVIQLFEFVDNFRFPIGPILTRYRFNCAFYFHLNLQSKAVTSQTYFL